MTTVGSGKYTYETVENVRLSVQDKCHNGIRCVVDASGLAAAVDYPRRCISDRGPVDPQLPVFLGWTCLYASPSVWPRARNVFRGMAGLFSNRVRRGFFGSASPRSPDGQDRNGAWQGVGMIRYRFHEYRIGRRLSEQGWCVPGVAGIDDHPVLPGPPQRPRHSWGIVARAAQGVQLELHRVVPGHLRSRHTSDASGW